MFTQFKTKRYWSQYECEPGVQTSKVGDWTEVITIELMWTLCSSLCRSFHTTSKFAVCFFRVGSIAVLRRSFCVHRSSSASTKGVVNSRCYAHAHARYIRMARRDISILNALGALTVSCIAIVSEHWTRKYSQSLICFVLLLWLLFPHASFSMSKTYAWGLLSARGNL